jgi:hypothetical protein
MARLPYIRMVGVTGSLAANNVVSEQDDIDFFFVTLPGRLWLARGLVVLIVRLAARRGIELCPNYLVAEPHLELHNQSLFTAYELVQLVPIYGQAAYSRLLASNQWFVAFLPNAAPKDVDARQLAPVSRGMQRLGEAMLNHRLGDALEEWERSRKIPRLRRVALEQGGSATAFSANLCKGHVDNHEAIIVERLSERLEAYVQKKPGQVHLR